MPSRHPSEDDIVPGPEGHGFMIKDRGLVVQIVFTTRDQAQRGWEILRERRSRGHKSVERK